MRFLIIQLIKFYQRAISPYRLPTCRFLPSCSTYSLEAVKRFGAIKGSFLAIKRILKCHPLHPGGIDLVPEKNDSKNEDI